MYAQRSAPSVHRTFSNYVQLSAGKILNSPESPIARFRRGTFFTHCQRISMSLPRFKLVFFCPAPNTRTILNHLFQKFPTQVGKIGNYDEVAFISRGTGQFQPGAGSKPAIGSEGTLEFVEEDRVEVVVLDKVREVVEELKAIHPYEEVAYDVYKVEDI
ncbi:hypothetical protein C8R43DRAFT_999572 [Mycena crocata]|nr:hypothetical protein C8R43DRAFT_999572 [Mycena crocata]